MLHPAVGSFNSNDVAFPYMPSRNDPFPTRAREVICELLGYEIPIANDIHRYIVLRICYRLDERFLQRICVNGLFYTLCSLFLTSIYPPFILFNKT